MTAQAGTNLAAGALGALGGLALVNDHGVPEWFMLVLITGSLLAGIWQSSSRPADLAQRKEARRAAKSNAAALWILAFVTVRISNTGVPGAMMTALVIGLLGGRALEALEASARGQQILDTLARWWLGGGPKP